MSSEIIYRETRDEKKLDRFFIENDLEYSEEHPVDTRRIKFWEAVDPKENLLGGLVLAIRQGDYIIDGIAVDERARGTGVGKTLLEMAREEARAGGGKEIYLVAKAPEFFSKYGYKALPREDAPEFFECATCERYGVTCHPEVMRLNLDE